ALGPSHPNVALSLNNLALLYQARGAGQKALPLFSRAFSISEQTLRQVRLLATESRLDAFLKALQKDTDALYSLPRELSRDPAVLRLALTTALLRQGHSLNKTTLASRELSQMQHELVRSADQADFTQWQALRRSLAGLYLQAQGKPDTGQK